MIWNLVINKSAEKQLAKIQNGERRRILDAISILTHGPYESGLDVKKLQARPEWRLRVGKWRVMFDVDKGTITITVLKVDVRGDIYK